MGEVKIKAENFKKVQEITDSRRGNPFRSSGVREYTRQWLVIVDAPGWGAGMVCRAPGIPAPYSSYLSPNGEEFDDLAVLVDLSAQRMVLDSQFHWTVTAMYSTEVPEGGIPSDTNLGSDTRGSQNDPTLERPVIDWDWEDVNDVPSRDLDGKPYVNSALMPFTPAPGFPASRSVLVLRRNESIWSREKASKYAWAVNSDVFAGAKPGCAQCYPPRAKVRNRGKVQYYEVTYRIRFGLPKLNDPQETGAPTSREDIEKINLELQSFQPEILDQGTHQLQTTNPVAPFFMEPIPIIRYNAPVTRDVLLDGKGREAKRDKDGKVKPSFIKFRQFHSMPFRPIVEKGVLGGI